MTIVIFSTIQQVVFREVIFFIKIAIRISDFLITIRIAKNTQNAKLLILA